MTFYESNRYDDVPFSIGYIVNDKGTKEYFIKFHLSENLDFTFAPTIPWLKTMINEFEKILKEIDDQDKKLRRGRYRR